MAGANASPRRRLRLLCLHSFRTSSAVFQTQLKWGLNSGGLLDEFCDLEFLDGLPATGPPLADVAGLFPPPYYEWWNASDDAVRPLYVGWDETLARVQHAFETRGPFDGLLGFSQGSNLAAALAGLQQRGAALAGQPALKLIICVSGMRGRAEALLPAFEQPISVPAVFIIGEQDRALPPRVTEHLAAAFTAPLVLRHARGHVVPKLGEAEEEALRAVLRNACGIGASL